MVNFKETVLVEQQQQQSSSMSHSHSTSFNKYNTNGTRPEDYQNQLMESLQSSMSSLSLTAVTKLKRSASHKRKLIKKMPLIKKELEEESNLNKNTERLIQSIIECNVNNLKKSIDNGANVNIKYNNWSLLHYACSMIDQAHFGTEQHLEMIRILLENGAEINTLDEDRWTPLHLACQQGMTSVISYLIKKGADKEASTIENLRPIDLVEPDNYIAISFLISSSVNCNERHL